MPVAWAASSLDEWWETSRDTSRMLSMLLERLTPDEAGALRARSKAHLQEYLADDGTIAVPGLAPCRRRDRATPSLEDRLAERARDELDRGQCGRVLTVEDRIRLDDLEGAGDPRLGDELAGEMRLAVGQPAAHGRADTGRDLRVERVEVE